jgi:hypothetical protein
MAYLKVVHLYKPLYACAAIQKTSEMPLVDGMLRAEI